MNTEELLHHLSIIKDFEPFTDGIFLYQIIFAISTVMLLISFFGISYYNVTKGLKVNIAGGSSVALLISSIAAIVFIKFEFDNHKDWSLEEGYESIMLASEIVYGEATSKEISYDYIRYLLIDGMELVRETDNLKSKLRLMGLEVSEENTELIKGHLENE